MQFLYIIYSKTVDKYYTGESSDTDARLAQHNSGYFKNSYTKIAKDWELKLVIEFSTIEQARAAEGFIKKMNSCKFIERLLLDNNWLKEKFMT